MQKNKSLPSVVGILLAFNAQLVHAENIEKGKAKAAACAGCHGAQGVAIAPNFPNLAGQKKTYLKTAIDAYRNGQRNDPTMMAMVAGLTDEDVVNLAAYYASLPPR